MPPSLLFFWALFRAVAFVLLKTLLLFKGGGKKQTNTFVEKNYDLSLLHVPVSSICLDMKIKHSIFTYKNCTQG